jgi:hypothetical protein
METMNACIIYDMPQRSPEWFEIRKGYLTASQFGEWLTKSGKTAEKAALTAASKVLAEMAGYPDPPPYETDDMRRGVELEPVARGMFADHFGIEVREVGFCASRTLYAGCSPDGIAGDAGLEIKIPRPSKLIQYHENPGIPDEYRPQVHGSMCVTGARVWHFWAWHPGFPPVHRVAMWNEYTDAMMIGLRDYSEYFAGLIQRMKEREEKYQ